MNQTCIPCKAKHLRAKSLVAEQEVEAAARWRRCCRAERLSAADCWHSFTSTSSEETVPGPTALQQKKVLQPSAFWWYLLFREKATWQTIEHALAERWIFKVCVLYEHGLYAVAYFWSSLWLALICNALELEAACWALSILASFFSLPPPSLWPLSYSLSPRAGSP